MIVTTSALADGSTLRLNRLEDSLEMFDAVAAGNRPIGNHACSLQRRA